jgi:hypothetical protein
MRLMTWPELRTQLAINTRGKCLDLDGMSRVPGGRRNPYGMRSAELLAQDGVGVVEYGAGW